MPALPPEVLESLAKLPEDLRESVRRAAEAGHDPLVLAEAENMAKDRALLKAKETLTQLNRLADAALDNAYGPECAAATYAALRGGRTPEALNRVGRIVAEAKTSTK